MTEDINKTDYYYKYIPRGNDPHSGKPHNSILVIYDKTKNNPLYAFIGIDNINENEKNKL